jgi:hypothetical protein
VWLKKIYTKLSFLKGNGMKIQRALFSYGKMGSFVDDQKAIKADVKQESFL